MTKGLITLTLITGLLNVGSGCSVDKGPSQSSVTGPISAGGPIISPVTPPPLLPDALKEITVSIVGDGQVLINGDKVCTSVRSPCSYNLNQALSPVITVLPTAGVLFFYWLNCPNPSGTICYGNSSESSTIIANFAPHEPSPPVSVPSLSVSDASVDEGGFLDFVISLSQAAPTNVNVFFSLSDQTAVFGINYTAPIFEEITIPPGETTAHIYVQTIDDLSYSPQPQTMILNLNNVNGAEVQNSNAVGTIRNINIQPLAIMTNLSVQAELNSSINIQGTLSNASNFCGVYADQSNGLSKTISLGTLTITDPQALKFSFTPVTGARGDADFTVYVCSGTQKTTAHVRISIDNPLANLQPGIAVRASACIYCHATINSNVITDFGFGNDYFFGQRSNLPWDYGTVYGNNSGNWQGTVLSGKIIVPHEATISQTLKNSFTYLYPANKPPPLVSSVADFLRWYLNSNSDGSKYQVTEAKSIFIGAPTASRLREAAGKQPSDGPIKFLPENQSVPTLSNFKVVTGMRPDDTTGDYVTNDPSTEIVCNGDVLIDAPLFLNQPKINSVSGCRLYVTQTVFLEAPLTYTNESSTTNLQISSSKAILAGIGWNDCGVNWRDDEPVVAGRNHSILGRIKDYTYVNSNTFVRNMTSGNPQDFFDSVYSDALLIPRADLLDAKCQTANTTSVTIHGKVTLGSSIVNVSDTSPLQAGMSLFADDFPPGSRVQSILSSTAIQIGIGTSESVPANGSSVSEILTFTNPRNLSLNHILINAPIVHSRYTGDVQGAIISEYALMSLGLFSYSFDPIFLSVPVLPLLNTNEYLDVQTSGASPDNNLPPVAGFTFRHLPVNNFNHRLDFYPYSQQFRSKPLTYDPDGSIASISFNVEQISPLSINPFVPSPHCQVGSIIQPDDHLCREANNDAFYSVTIGANYGTYRVTETVTDNVGAVTTTFKDIVVDQESESKFDTRYSVSPMVNPGIDKTTYTFSILNDEQNRLQSTDYQYRWNITAASVHDLDTFNVHNPCAYQAAETSPGSTYVFGKSLIRYFDLSEPTIFQNANCPEADSSVPNIYQIQLRFTDWTSGITMFRNYNLEIDPL